MNAHFVSHVIVIFYFVLYISCIVNFYGDKEKKKKIVVYIDLKNIIYFFECRPKESRFQA